MSVAFRRENDEEHLEPKFDRPVPPGPNLVTPRGFQLIADEVARIEAMLPDAEEPVRADLARDLRYWRTRLATARIAAAPAEGEVGFGSRVRFRLNGVEQSITIVGADEADPETGLVGFAAPLARALMGAVEGDMLPFGSRDEAIAVLAIEP